MSEKKNHPDITDATDADDALDIFADDIDAKKLNKATEKNTYQQDSNGMFFKKYFFFLAS